MREQRWWPIQMWLLTQLCVVADWESSASPKRTSFGRTCVIDVTVWLTSSTTLTNILYIINTPLECNVLEI